MGGGLLRLFGAGGVKAGVIADLTAILIQRAQ
jgi:hypothetical protein